MHMQSESGAEHQQHLSESNAEQKASAELESCNLIAVAVTEVCSPLRREIVQDGGCSTVPSSHGDSPPCSIQQRMVPSWAT